MFSTIKSYVYGGAAVVVFLLSLTIYVQHQTILTKNAEIQTLRTEASISSQSITDLTKELNSVTVTLVNKERQELVKQAELKTYLKAVETRDKTLKGLEESLRKRTPVTNCPVPKDLQDAWNAL